LEELDFVEGSFGISGRGFDDFECDVSVHSGTESVCGVKKNEKRTDLSSFASQTVEKWPQPSFLTTVYLPLEKESPMWTGW
jgi:hypothetical protein